MAEVVDTLRIPAVRGMVAGLPLGWRVLLYLAALTGFAWVIFYWRVAMANLAVPWLKLVCALIERTYEIAELNIRQNTSEWVFHLRLVSEEAVNLHGRHLPRLDVSATTLVTYYLQHLFILGAVLLSGLFLVPVRWWKLLPALVGAFLLSVGVDIPLTLLGSIEGLILQALAPERLDGSLLVKMERALNSGGRMGLALGLGGLCLAASRVRAQ